MFPGTEENSGEYVSGSLGYANRYGCVAVLFSILFWAELGLAITLLYYGYNWAAPLLFLPFFTGLILIILSGTDD